MSMLLDPPIALRGELSLADAAAGHRLLESHRPRRAGPHLFIVLVSVIATAGVTIHEMDLADGEWIVGGLVLLVGVMLCWWRYDDQYRLYQSWKRKGGIFRAVDSTITADGLVIREPHATITVEWPHFVGALLGPTVVFLFPQEGWILFGRSRFADERDWNRFRAFVEDRWPITPRFI